MYFWQIVDFWDDHEFILLNILYEVHSYESMSRVYRPPTSLSRLSSLITLTTNDNEIEDMVEDVEEENENELQENVILEEEDDLSDLDLEDDK